MKLLFLFFLSIGFTLSIQSQSLVYKPINPAFGGDTFNYQWLMSSAEAQNKHKEDTVDPYKQLSESDRFKENLNNQLLNKISSSLFESQFGDNGISEGTYTFGSLSVDVYPSNLGLVVDILDVNTGEQTQVVVPNN